jgi:ribonuclease D
MPDVFQYIQTDAALAGIVPLLTNAPSLAFDLEFDRDRHTYGFDLCLIQVATPQDCFVIDPAEIADLSPIWQVFENPAIHKLVHCPGEDMRLLHQLQCYPQNLTDTEVIAKLLNYEHTSLAKLLEPKCGIQLDKKMQQSNWHKRPLSAEQLRYAADDVLHLHNLYKVLYAEAEANNLSSWVKEESDWLQQVRYTTEERTNFLKPADLRNLSPKNQYILQQIFLLRDGLARQKNKPAYMIIPEETLREWAELHPQQLEYVDTHRLHPSIRRGNILQQIKKKLIAFHEEADKMNLSNKVIRETFSAAEKQRFYEQKQQQSHLKANWFAPVQQTLYEQVGQFAGRYILSNAWVNKWLQGEVHLTDLKPAYKWQLIESIGRQKNLDPAELHAYENNFGKMDKYARQ